MGACQGEAACVMSSQLDQIHALWDALAEYGPSRMDEALDHAMASLAELLDAQQAHWHGSVQLGAPDGANYGWRGVGVRYLHPQPEHEAAYREHCRRLEKGQVDPTVLANARGAGQYRITILNETAPPGWYEGEFYHALFKPFAIRDVMYVVTPLNADVECFLGFKRIGEDKPLFGDRERALLDQANRSLKWFHRNVALHRGYLVAEKPLTPAERRVLQSLLRGGSEREIAAEVGLTPNSVHTYAKRIYRKFNVKGRAGLTALWLG